MPRLKYFNDATQEWEYVIVGGQGPQGETGPGIAAGGTAGQIIAKVDGTDYNTEWIDNYTEQVKHTVKAGEALTKGQAVYVSSANGTNMIVSKASNSGESTSSKTMGLVAQTMLLNDQGFVVTEGLLSGLNTASATAGDPVWLGTSGDLIYGLSNKPAAPAHLVFIGIVTRVHATQGEIWVKVQNGFELDELHDVSITSPTAGDIVARNSANTLWENMTLAEAGVSAVGHTHDDRYYTETETDNLLDAKANKVNGIFTPSSTIAVPLIAKATTSQATDIQQWQDSSGIAKARINATGKLYIDTPSDYGTVAENNGTGGIEVKSTNTTAASMSFHVPNIIATNIGVDAVDARFAIGGWTLPARSLTIDVSGRVQMPNQPAFHYNSAGGSWTSGQVISFNNASYAVNNGSYYNTSNMRFTAPIAGRYYFYVTMLSANDASAIDWRYYKNGAVFAGAGYTGAFASGYKQTNGHAIMSLSAGDYVDVRAFGTVGLHGDVVHNSFGGYLIG